MFGIFDPACELLPHGRRNYTSVLLPLYLLSDPPPPPPKVNVQYIIYIQTVCGCGEGWGVLSCVVDHILQVFNTMFLITFRTYKISTPPHTKMMTSKDDM
jgi:hypothetical protein